MDKHSYRGAGKETSIFELISLIFVLSIKMQLVAHFQEILILSDTTQIHRRVFLTPHITKHPRSFHKSTDKQISLLINVEQVNDVLFGDWLTEHFLNWIILIYLNVHTYCLPNVNEIFSS